MLRQWLGSVFGFALLVACDAQLPSEIKENNVSGTLKAGHQTPDPKYGAFGIDLTAVDNSISAGDDFYRHVNGKWLDSFELPADKSRYGVFTALADEAEIQVRAIIEEAANVTDPDPLTDKIAKFYAAYMDVEAIEALGLSTIQPMLDMIAAIESREDLARVFATTGFSAPVGGWVDVDSKQTDRYIFYWTQAGLGLPDRNYYLNDEKFAEIREKYEAYLSDMLSHAGYEKPEEAAASVLALETQMVEYHWERAKRRDRDLTYNLMSREEFEDMAGDFPLAVFLDNLDLNMQDEFVIRESDAIAGLLNLAASASLADWKAYLSAHLLSDFSSVLPKAIDEATFAFYGTALRGQPEQRQRWKRGVSAVEGALGEAIGQIYVDRHFPEKAKIEMDKLVANLRVAVGQRLEALEWMGDDTKVEAFAKLEKFTPKIGYPDEFEAYDSLSVLADNAFANRVAVSKWQWQWQDMISQLGQPIDKGEWFMTPQTVNAYYSPNRNEIVFPAAILQPPFFNLSADPAVNYGAIGAVIGHEIGHGFDDQGSKSDGDGVLRNWWTDEDRMAFKARTSALVKQYNAFCPLEDSCVNGKLSLGENIGDLGGLSMAYTAYQLSLDGREAPVIDGYTGDQRFFMAWAQVWRGLYRDEALRLQLERGPHSPPRYRVNGVVRNMDVWYEAFGIEESAALYLPPEERVSIW